MKKIMIIDDDVCIGDMLEELLAKENYSTVRAYSGTEALLYLSSHRPDLILLDLMLPGLSGEELLPQHKKRILLSCLLTRSGWTVLPGLSPYLECSFTSQKPNMPS